MREVHSLPSNRGIALTAQTTSRKVHSTEVHIEETYCSLTSLFAGYSSRCFDSGKHVVHEEIMYNKLNLVRRPVGTYTRQLVFRCSCEGRDCVVDMT
jgi:hypothetical protein